MFIDFDLVLGNNYGKNMTGVVKLYFDNNKHQENYLKIICQFCNFRSPMLKGAYLRVMELLDFSFLE